MGLFGGDSERDTDGGDGDPSHLLSTTRNVHAQRHELSGDSDRGVGPFKNPVFRRVALSAEPLSLGSLARHDHSICSTGISCCAHDRSASLDAQERKEGTSRRSSRRGRGRRARPDASADKSGGPTEHTETA